MSGLFCYKERGRRLYSVVFLQASDRELQWVIRGSLVVVGLAGMCLAFGEKSVFALWILSGDLLYCIIFPQLACVLHVRFANGYGMIAGFVAGMVLRILSGEPALSIPALLLYPWWKEIDGVIIQYFPFRTFAVICSAVCIVGISKLAELGFHHKKIPESWDVLQAFQEDKQRYRTSRVCTMDTKL